MFYIMPNETLPVSSYPRHWENVQGLLGQKFRFLRLFRYCSTLVIEFEKRLSTPALLIAVAANSYVPGVRPSTT